MANKSKHPKVLPYLSGEGYEKRFIQIGDRFLLHPKVRDLSNSAFRLYMCLAMEAGGQWHTDFSHGTAKKYGMPSSTYDRAIKELVNAGFIVRTYNQDESRFTKAKYRFTITWKEPFSSARSMVG